MQSRLAKSGQKLAKCWLCWPRAAIPVTLKLTIGHLNPLGYFLWKDGVFGVVQKCVGGLHRAGVLEILEKICRHRNICWHYLVQALTLANGKASLAPRVPGVHSGEALGVGGDSSF